MPTGASGPAIRAPLLMSNKLPPPAQLPALLLYDPETGDLVWRKRPIEMFANARSCGTWNGRYAGKLAFRRLDRKGYWVGTICWRSIQAHRVIWALVYGEWPKCIDHINGVRSDNRLCNLRSVSYAENSKNRLLNKNSTTGVAGVKAAPKGRWAAHIRVNRRFHYLGAFDTIAEAAEARRAAEVKFGFYRKGELADV